MLNADNFVKLLDEIEEAEANMERNQAAQSEAARNMQAEQLNIESNKHLDELDFKYYEVNIIFMGDDLVPPLYFI